MKSVRIILIFMGIAVLAFAAFNWAKGPKVNINNAQNPPLVTGSDVEFEGSEDGPNAEMTTVIARGLDTPWSLAFLPGGNILITERGGRVRIIEDGKLLPQEVLDLDKVREIGEGGLLGIALDPGFSENFYVYLYYTYGGTGNNTFNRVSRFEFRDRKLSGEKVIVDAIPGASNHNGGRIKFGPDSFLYITTGDAQEPSRSQDRNSLAGKILRVKGDGNPAPGNPFGNPVYSYGHRNSQGIAWDGNGDLFATEHGRSGALSGLDEINRITPGKNYGWPDIEGDKFRTGMETPVLNSGSDTWAPGGTAIVDGKMYFTGLRGSALYKYDISAKNLNEYFKNELGRIRDVVAGPDGMLYIATSNLDGRGDPRDGDDKIIRINPQLLP